MAQDAAPIVQIAEEPADMISEQQPQHRRLKDHPHSAKDENDGKESENRRHLSPEAVMGSMKSMTASYSVNPAQNVQLACPKEIIHYCYSEALDAIATFEKSANPDDVRSALRNVNMCLARNSHALSQPCLATLMESLQLPPAPPMFFPVPTQTYSATAAGGWTPPVPDNTEEYRGGGYPDSDHEKHHKRGHKRFRHNDDNDDGDSGVHPLVWAFILPFFFIGLIASLKRGVTHFHKWQRERLAQQGVQRDEDYAPLKTQEPS